MSDYDGDFMYMSSDCDQNDNGLNPVSETFPQTNLSTDPQSEQRFGCLHDRVVARLGVDIPPLEIERVSPLANPFTNPILVPSQSANLFSTFSSQIIPNNGSPQMVESSGGDHATMMISNNSLPHQSVDVDLPPQGGSNDIPAEESVDSTSHESNADSMGASLVPSLDSEVVANK